MSRCLYSGFLADEAIDEIIRSLPIAMDGVGRRRALPLAWLHALPTPENRRFAKAVGRLHELTERMIADYRANDADPGDVLAVLLAARDEDTGEPMSDQQIHDEVVAILVAAVEA